MQQVANFVLIMMAILNTAIAQESFIEVTQGAGYANDVYYSLETDSMTVVQVDQWDIAFTGGASADIIINEGAASSGGQLGLYRLSPTYSFEDTLQPPWAEARLYNAESGQVAGAFSRIANPANPFDLGWGIYDPISHTVSNGPAYMIQQRDSSWLKFRVQTLAGGKFIFEYAALDGAGYTVDTVDTRGDAARAMIHYSLRDQRVVEEIPPQWDLVFTRYTTPLDDGEGNTLDYLVTGVLQAPGIDVAEVHTTEPATRTYDAAQDSFQQAVDVIGYDWKSFNLQTFQFSIDPERVFFVKSRTGEIWKMQFIDFEGSSSGVSVFVKSRQDVVSSTESFTPPFRVEVFPNPATDQINVDWQAQGAGMAPVPWRMVDMQGQISQHGVFPPDGRLTIHISNLPAGVYLLQLGEGKRLFTKKVIKRH